MSVNQSTELSSPEELVTNYRSTSLNKKILIPKYFPDTRKDSGVSNNKGQYKNRSEEKIMNNQKINHFKKLNLSRQKKLLN